MHNSTQNLARFACKAGSKAVRVFDTNTKVHGKSRVAKAVGGAAFGLRDLQLMSCMDGRPVQQ